MPNWYDWAGPMHAGLTKAELLREELLRSEAERERLAAKPVASIDEQLKALLFGIAQQQSGGDPLRFLENYGKLGQLLRPPRQRQPVNISEQDISASESALDKLGVLPSVGWTDWLFGREPDILLRRRLLAEAEARRLRGSPAGVLELAQLFPR